MSLIAIVYHSGYGHTAKQAEAVARGALIRRRRDGGAGQGRGRRPPLGRSRKSRRDHFWIADLHGQRVGAVQNLHGRQFEGLGGPGLEGQARRRVHQFRQSERRQARHAATIGGFRRSARHDLDRSRPHAGKQFQRGSVDDLNRLGGYLGAMAQSNADQGPEHGPTSADLKTAEHLGRRVAQAAQRWGAAVAA